MHCLAPAPNHNPALSIANGKSLPMIFSLQNLDQKYLLRVLPSSLEEYDPFTSIHCYLLDVTVDMTNPRGDLSHSGPSHTLCYPMGHGL